jgi:hypothetical protein
MLMPVILTLGVLWSTVVLVFVAACRMAARGDSVAARGDGALSAGAAGCSHGNGLTVWESLPASARLQAPRNRARPMGRGARGHAGRSAARS